MRVLRLACALAAAAALTAGCGGSGADTKTVRTTTTKVQVVEGSGAKVRGFDPRAIYEREAAGVVTVLAVFGGSGLDALLRGDSGSDSGLGSGFVLNASGEVVTNAHVVTTGDAPDLEPAREVYVAFADGNRVPAKVRGYDPEADVALLKIDPAGLDLNPLPLGSSGDVEVGSPVAAMGSPFGEEQSLSVGVVSAVDRTISSLTKFAISGAIQTDAAINPGNSGGPLVDARGRVIGLNQQIRSATGGGEGVGFAIPIDLAKRSIRQLRERGRAEYAFIGVTSVAVYPQLAERFGLPAERGAWIQKVEAGGPAQEAGLRGGSATLTRFQAASVRVGGDVIVAIDDTPVADPNDLGRAIAAQEPGDTVDVVLYRGDSRRTVPVKLSARPSGSGARLGR